MITQQMNVLTSGHVGPKCDNASDDQKSVVPFLINGCTVSFSPNRKGSEETIKTVKEILLSAYRAKSARG